MGPLCQGNYTSLTRFWFFKSGRRKGKPFSRCRDCLNYQRWGSTDHGWVPYNKIGFVFEELQFRLGKMETCRRIGVSINYFSRRLHEDRTRVNMNIARRAMLELMKCRENNEVRHKDSVHRGTTARGEKDRIPIREKDYYSTSYDYEKDQRGKTEEDAWLTSLIE
jgi:hypothetical protein